MCVHRFTRPWRLTAFLIPLHSTTLAHLDFVRICFLTAREPGGGCAVLFFRRKRKTECAQRLHLDSRARASVTGFLRSTFCLIYFSRAAWAKSKANNRV